MIKFIPMEIDYANSFDLIKDDKFLNLETNNFKSFLIYQFYVCFHLLNLSFID